MNLKLAIAIVIADGDAINEARIRSGAINFSS